MICSHFSGTGGGVCNPPLAHVWRGHPAAAPYGERERDGSRDKRQSVKDGKVTKWRKGEREEKEEALKE